MFEKSNKIILVQIMHLVFLLPGVTAIAQTLTSGNDSVKKNFDEELGFRNESRFINSHALELRATDKFYTQTDFYNTKMLRVSSDFRSSYSRVTVEGTYAFTGRMQGGILFDDQHIFNRHLPSKALDFFSNSSNKKFITGNLQFFGKYKWYEQKFRFSTLAYATVPLENKRPGNKNVVALRSYDFALQCLYDRYPASFMRMILTGEFKLHYFTMNKITTLEFNPSSRFIFTLIRTRPVKLSAMMDLIWSANKDNVNPFAGIESAAANITLLKNLDLNAMYQYYFIGESTGAGHAFKLELRWEYGR